LATSLRPASQRKSLLRINGSEKSRSCAACLQMPQELSDNGTHEAVTITCYSGMCDTVVPVRLGDRLYGGRIGRANLLPARCRQHAALKRELLPPRLDLHRYHEPTCRNRMGRVTPCAPYFAWQEIVAAAVGAHRTARPAFRLAESFKLVGTRAILHQQEKANL